MPSTKKALHFLSCALLVAISVGLLGFGMSAEWAKMSMECQGVESNGTAVITLELFAGTLERDFCPFGSSNTFEVFYTLPKVGGAPVALHGIVCGLLVLCLLFSAVCILISLYNAVSNPYETYMGPRGVYVCTGVSAILSLLVLILFVVNIETSNMAKGLVPNVVDNFDATLKNKSSEMRVGYYLVIPYMVLSILAAVVIYLYDHAAYTHRKEQQKPTEDAPKEIMMY